MGSGFARKKKEQKAMHEQLRAMQAKMETASAEGVAGNGLVRVQLDGQMKMTRLVIQKECVDPEDIEGLTLLICAAHEDARNKLSGQTGGGDVSSLLGLGF